MKPCAKNRKLIAWLAVDALDAAKAVALREHLAQCEGCRCYWEEISNLTLGLASPAAISKVEASESFRHAVAEKLRTVESRPQLEKLVAWLRESMLRVALPVGAASIVALFAMIVMRHKPAPPLLAPQAVEVVSVPSSRNDLAPTIANYQMVASQSLEKLDELLTQQGNKKLPSVPRYTGLFFGGADESF